MALVKTCCGYWELKDGAKNIAIFSMVYDVAMAAALLLVLCIYIPIILWEDQNPIKLVYVYKVMLIVSICIRFLHLIPSFLLLYSTWEEIQRGVSFWLFSAYIDILLHGAWLAVPFIMVWRFDMMILLVAFLVLAILIAFYFISVVASYLSWVKERDQDLRARRRLKEFY